MPLILQNALNVHLKEIGSLFIASFDRAAVLDEEETSKTLLITDQKIDQKTDQKPTREQVLELLRENSKMTRDDLAAKTGVSASAIKQHLANLQTDGKLERIGGRKDGYWKVHP